MLVLTRRPGEGILLGHDIEIVVIGVEGSHVRLGIRAPRGVRVLRSELLHQVEEENHRAATGSGVGDLSRLEGTFALPVPHPTRRPNIH